MTSIPHLTNPGGIELPPSKTQVWSHDGEWTLIAELHSKAIKMAVDNYKVTASSFPINSISCTHNQHFTNTNTSISRTLSNHHHEGLYHARFPALALGAATPKLPVSSIDPACLESITSVADCIKNLKPTGAAALTDVATW